MSESASNVGDNIWDETEEGFIRSLLDNCARGVNVSVGIMSAILAAANLMYCTVIYCIVCIIQLCTVMYCIVCIIQLCTVMY